MATTGNTSKEINQYIHLYLGCEVFGTYNDASGSRGYLTGITNGGTECEIQFILEDGINVDEEPVFNTIDEIKLILRPLSSMTEEEMNDIFGQRFAPPFVNDLIDQMSESLFGLHKVLSYYSDFDTIPKLLSKHFDLFRLIESGLALDKTLVKN